MGHGERKEVKKEAAGDGKGQTPGEWGETLGAAKPPELTPIPTEWNGMRGGVRPPEWWKPPGGAATEWGEGSNCLRTTRPATESQVMAG